MTSKVEQNDQLVTRGRGAVSRRHFLRGLGACVAVPGFASLRLPRCLPPKSPRVAAWRLPQQVLRSARPSFTFPTELFLPLGGRSRRGRMFRSAAR